MSSPSSVNQSAEIIPSMARAQWRTIPSTIHPRLSMETMASAPPYSVLPAVDAQMGEDTSVPRTDTPRAGTWTVVSRGEPTPQTPLLSTISGTTGDIADETTALGPPEANRDAVVEAAEPIDGEASLPYPMPASDFRAMAKKVEDIDEAPSKYPGEEARAAFALLGLRYGAPTPLLSTIRGTTGAIADATTASGPPRTNRDAIVEAAEPIDGEASLPHRMPARDLRATPMNGDINEARLKRAEDEACAAFALMEMRYETQAPEDALKTLAQGLFHRGKGGAKYQAEAGKHYAGRLWEEHMEKSQKAQQEPATKQPKNVPAALKNSDGYMWTEPVEGKRKRTKTRKFGE